VHAPRLFGAGQFGAAAGVAAAAGVKRGEAASRLSPPPGSVAARRLHDLPLRPSTFVAVPGVEGGWLRGGGSLVWVPLLCLAAAAASEQRPRKGAKGARKRKRAEAEDDGTPPPPPCPPALQVRERV
jgi:hypothetical protein